MWEPREHSGMWPLWQMPAKSPTRLESLNWLLVMLKFGDYRLFLWPGLGPYAIGFAFCGYHIERGYRLLRIHAKANRSQHGGQARSWCPVKCPPDTEAVAWARGWLPVTAVDRLWSTLAAPEGGTGEHFAGAYHITGSLHMLSCTGLMGRLSAVTLDKLGTRGTKGFRTLPNAQVLKSTFKHRSKSLTLSLHCFLLSCLSLPILSDKLLCQAYEFKDWLLCRSFLMSLWPFTQSVMSDHSMLDCSEDRLCITEV